MLKFLQKTLLGTKTNQHSEKKEDSQNNLWDANNNLRFFIFANRLLEKYRGLDEFLTTHPDYNKSVIILFNRAKPLEFQSVANHPRKWIFYRRLVNVKHSSKVIIKIKDFVYQGIEHLLKYNFELVTPVPNDNKSNQNFYKFLQNNLERLPAQKIFSLQSHCDLNPYYDRLNKNKKPWERRQSASTGLIIFLQLQEMFPNAKFTLIGFNSKLSANAHNPSEEKLIWQDLLKQDNLEAYECFTS